MAQDLHPAVNAMIGAAAGVGEAIAMQPTGTTPSVIQMSPRACPERCLLPLSVLEDRAAAKQIHHEPCTQPSVPVSRGHHSGAAYHAHVALSFPLGAVCVGGSDLGRPIRCERRGEYHS